MIAPATDRRLRLALTCRCVILLQRRAHDGRFVVAEAVRDSRCTVHESLPPAGTQIVGFGPYPDWSADVASRVNSLPEAGGVMEGEHAFILDEQFCFVAGPAAPRPCGPIRDARWEALAG